MLLFQFLLQPLKAFIETVEETSKKSGSSLGRNDSTSTAKALFAISITSTIIWSILLATSQAPESRQTLLLTLPSTS